MGRCAALNMAAGLLCDFKMQRSTKKEMLEEGEGEDKEWN